MNFEEVRKNPVYFEDRFVVGNGLNHLEGMHLPPEDYDQQYSPRRAIVVDGQPRHIPGNVTMDGATTNHYMNLDKTHLSHSNLKATINAEIHDMKRQTEDHVMVVQTDDYQSFCPETIIARLNFDSVNFRVFDVKEAAPLFKDPLEYGQVCLTEKRIFFVSRRRADYTVHIHPESKKTFDQTPTVTTQPQVLNSTFAKQKPSSYRLQMDQNIGSSYYEMIPVWNVKSVSMNTSGKSTSSVLIYSKSSCCGRCCGCCSCLRDLLELILCDKCLFAPGKTWHSATHRGQNNLLFENHDGVVDNLGSYNPVRINRKLMLHATLPAWDQRAVIEIVVDAPTSIDKIADFIRLLQHHSQLLNAPT